MGDQRKRIWELDCFRFFCVFSIFLFHTYYKINCTFGVVNDFARMGAVCMSGFFMLSGYSLYYSYSDKKGMMELSQLKHFYKTRFIALLPKYYIMYLLYMLFLNRDDLATSIVLIPIELTGTQMMFGSLAQYSHNGGTWFVSCLVICYLLFPFIKEIVSQLNHHTKIIALAVIIGILLYIPFMTTFLKTVGVYNNPMFRLIEFALGMILSSLKQESEEFGFAKYMFGNRFIHIMGYIVLVFLVEGAMYFQIAVDNWSLYNWIVIPMFSLILLSVGGLNLLPFIETVLAKFAAISYEFFLVQYFTWPITEYTIGLNGSVFFRFVFALIVNLFLSIILHYYCKFLYRRRRIA